MSRHAGPGPRGWLNAGIPVAGRLQSRSARLNDKGMLSERGWHLSGKAPICPGGHASSLVTRSRSAEKSVRLIKYIPSRLAFVCTRTARSPSSRSIDSPRTATPVSRSGRTSAFAGFHCSTMLPKARRASRF